MSLFKVLSLPGSPELPQCAWVLVWGKSEPWTGAMRVGVGWSGVGIKRREDMIHGRVGSSRETAADLQSEGRWTGTKALFRQSECSVSCDGWRRSVWEPLSRCVSRSHLQASTVNRDQMADARGPSGTCALRHTNDYGCRPINGHICKGEQQPAHWEWVSSFNSPLEHRHAGVNVGIKTQVKTLPFSQFRSSYGPQLCSGSTENDEVLWPPWEETLGSLLVELENWYILVLDFRTESEGHSEWKKKKKRTCCYSSPLNYLMNSSA